MADAKRQSVLMIQLQGELQPCLPLARDALRRFARLAREAASAQPVRTDGQVLMTEVFAGIEDLVGFTDAAAARDVSDGFFYLGAALRARATRMTVARASDWKETSALVQLLSKFDTPALQDILRYVAQAEISDGVMKAEESLKAVRSSLRDSESHVARLRREVAQSRALILRLWIGAGVALVVLAVCGFLFARAMC